MFKKLCIGTIKLVKNALKTPTLQVELTKGFVVDDVRYVEPYGFTSHPINGAECLVLNMDGCGDKPVALVAGGRLYRLQTLKPGEIALYTDEGDCLVFKRGQNVELKTKTFTVTAETTNISGDLNVGKNITSGGEITDKTSSMTSMRETYNAHNHTGNAGAPTSAPEQTMGG